MKISALVPNYNHGHYLDRCIKRYVNQEFKPIEIIIVDDGSTDNSVEIIENLILKYKKEIKIILVKNTNNLGIQKTFRNNYINCNGDFIYFGSATDGIEKIFFSEARKGIRLYPNVKIIYGDVKVVDEKLNLIYLASLKNIYKSQLISPKLFYKKILLKESLGFSLSSSTIYKKEILDKFDFNNPNLRGYSDTFTTNSLCLIYNSFYIKKFCSFWVFEKNSYSQKTSLFNSFKIFYHSSKLMIFSKNYKGVYPKYYSFKWIMIYPLKIILRYVKKKIDL